MDVTFKSLDRVVFVVVQLAPDGTQIACISFGNDLVIIRDIESNGVNGIPEEKYTSRRCET